MALLKKQRLWSELVAHNCLLNWVFGYHSHGHGRMPPWGCRDGKAGNCLGEVLTLGGIIVIIITKCKK